MQQLFRPKFEHDNYYYFNMDIRFSVLPVVCPIRTSEENQILVILLNIPFYLNKNYGVYGLEIFYIIYTRC